MSVDLHRRGGFRAGWPIRSIAAGQLVSLVRLAVFLVIASSVVASLVLMLPVAAYYQTADFTEARFDLEVDGLITDEAKAALEKLAVAGSTATLVAIDPAALRANGREASPAKVYFSPEPETIDNTWFRDSESLAEGGTAESDWIDLSADAARALGVGPGDSVSVPFLGHDVAFTVRRIMAIARFGIRNVGVGPLSAPMREALASAESGATPGVLFMRSSAGADEVRKAVSGVPGGSKLQVQSRAEWLAQTSVEPTLSEPTRLAATVLGFAALIALALREGTALFDRRRRAFSILVALGATPSRVVTTAVIVEAVPVVAAMLIAWVVTRYLAYGFVFAAALPPAFNGPLVIGLAAAAGAYLATVAASARRHLSRHDLVRALTTQ
jgi:hypothetical protein